MSILPPGFLIGEHTVVRRVAQGAMGAVYEGRHVDSGQPVAVKVLHPEWCLHAEAVARFLNEAHALQQIQHVHLVKALAFGTLSDEAPYMVLEWMPADLHQVLGRAGGRLSLQAAVRVAGQLAGVLSMLHEHGIVHRDLKPANVLLAGDEPSALHVKLADLGLAKRLPGGSEPLSALPVSTAGSALLGTWDYMAPEQWIQSKGVDSKADVYGLGVLLFQMLVGRLPFMAEQQKQLMCLHLLEPPPLELLGSLAPADLRGLISRMLNKKPAPRPTMREVLVQLAQG